MKTQKQKGYRNLFTFFLLIGDFLCLNLSIIITALLQTKHVIMFSDVRGIYVIQVLSMVIVTLMSVSVRSARVIHFDKLLYKAILFMFLQFVIYSALGLAFNLKQPPIGIVYEFYSIFATLYLGWWVLLRVFLKYYRKRGKNYDLIVIIGAGRTGIMLYQEMINDLSAGYNILGFLDDNKNVIIPDNRPYLGPIDAFYTLLEKESIDEVYCALPAEAEKKIISILKYCERNNINFHLVPEMTRYMKRRMNYTFVGQVPVLSLHDEPLQNINNRMLKRGFDILFSVAVLVLLSWLYFIIAIGIKLSSPGPVIFKQKRTGLKGNEFICYKFRSMRVNGDSDTLQATKDDPRKTKFGKFLRKTNLDELPQFYNVLIGDMSVIGPRPHMLKHTAEYSALIDDYMIRHLVKPGITGWSQVSGLRGETQQLSQMESRIKGDIYYIENWSLILDIKIIVLTVVDMFFTHKNAM